MNRRKFFKKLGLVSAGAVITPKVVVDILGPIATEIKVGADFGLGRDIAITTVRQYSTPFLDYVSTNGIRSVDLPHGKFSWYDHSFINRNGGINDRA